MPLDHADSEEIGIFDKGIEAVNVNGLKGRQQKMRELDVSKFTFASETRQADRMAQEKGASIAEMKAIFINSATRFLGPMIDLITHNEQLRQNELRKWPQVTSHKSLPIFERSGLSGISLETAIGLGFMGLNK